MPFIVLFLTFVLFAGSIQAQSASVVCRPFLGGAERASILEAIETLETREAVPICEQSKVDLLLDAQLFNDQRLKILGLKQSIEGNPQETVKCHQAFDALLAQMEESFEDLERRKAEAGEVADCTRKHDFSKQREKLRNFTHIVKAGAVNVRKGPGMRYEVIGRAEGGTGLLYESEIDGWGRFIYPLNEGEARKGWIFMENLYKLDQTKD